MTQEPSYTIGKLAERAETTPRTIRYYQEQGLLPSPETQGKYSYYSEVHLQRLRLIQRLKNAFLPLASIRTQMEGLADEEIDAILARCLPSTGEENPTFSDVVSVSLTESVPLGKRAAYLTQVLEVTGQALRLPEEETGEKRVRRALLVSPHLKPSEQSPEPSRESENPRQSAESILVRETWERVRLAPDVEIHFRLPETPQERQVLEQRITAAKALFEPES